MLSPAVPRWSLRLLGAAELRPASDAERTVPVPPKMMAVLIYLALTSRDTLQLRDTLVGLFWPELNQQSARSALRQVLHGLRELLGADVVVSEGKERVGLAREAVSCDAVAFEDAIAQGELESAVELYKGPLAVGFHSSGAPEFERWLDGERARRARQCEAVVEELALRAAERGDVQAAVERWRLAASQDPYNTRFAVGLMTALAAAGDGPNAVIHGEQHVAVLREELRMDPDPQVRQLLEDLRRSKPGAGPGSLRIRRARPMGTVPTRKVAGRRRYFTLAPAIVTGLFVLGVSVMQLRRSGQVTVTTSNLRAVTSEPGLEWQPAVSPDGSQVAYAKLGADGGRVFLRSTVATAGRGELQLGAGESPAWGPDGELVRFWTRDDSTWKEIGRLGGSMRSLDVPRSRRCSWSPDGSSTVCIDGAGTFRYQLADGRITRLSPDTLGHSFAWSPDGAWLAYVRGNASWTTELNVNPTSIWMVQTSGGEPVRVTGDEHMDVSPNWLDDNHLLFVSNRDGQREVYAVRVGPTGARREPVKVPGPSEPHALSYSIAGKKLASARLEDRQNIWSFSLAQDHPVSVRSGRPVTTGNQVIENHDVSPDGAWIVYDSDIGGNPDIYKRRVGGGEVVRLTSDPAGDFRPRWSPDGTEIAFGRQRAPDHGVLMVVPANGGTPVELPGIQGDTGDISINPVWSPTGLEIAFMSRQSGRPGVWLVARDSVGGPWYGSRMLTDAAIWVGDWAPDGRGVLLRADATLVLMSRDGERLWSRDLSEVGLAPRGTPRFSNDGDTVYFVALHSDGTDGVWSVPMRGGEPQLIVAYDDAARFPSWRLTVGPAHLFVTVGEYESDIWVMDVVF